ncbi:class I mannose-6-phosphate isomerase [Erythrobacter litoralis]|uniref:class I mannose-6-phosphate isomerase n=1 Tax=Erythrobacter litoralis TaxID=39960 RepID=UPI002435150C|nr:class I mannose-6-phosphate isomerase [Erythrobacter litoralis]
MEKPWGRSTLPDPFENANRDSKTGEIWFEPTAMTDALLAKYLFTSEKLSVQVHPSDETSPTGRGKDECWLVLDADPGAVLAVGFREEVSPEQIRKSAEDGSIEELLEWHPVKAGDFVYLPSGTVHAIGAGLTLLEIQQNTDITYRLYDYGRPRELHLDEALAVAKTGPHPAENWQQIDPDRSKLLVDGPKFRLAHIAGNSRPEDFGFDENLLVLPLSGTVRVNGQEIENGSAAEASAAAKVEIDSEARCMIASVVRNAD